MFFHHAPTCLGEAVRRRKLYAACRVVVPQCGTKLEASVTEDYVISNCQTAFPSYDVHHVRLNAPKGVVPQDFTPLMGKNQKLQS